MGKINPSAIFAGIAIGIFVAFTPPAMLVPLTVIFIGLMLGIYLIFSLETEQREILAKIFIGGFALRFLVCFVLAFMSDMKQGHIFFLGADDYGFSLNATRIVSAWKDTGYLPAPGTLKWMEVAGDLGYSYFLAYLYYFLGEYHFLPLFINITLGSLSIILFYRLAKKIYNRRVAVVSALLFSFWPSMVLWSTQNLKESITIFCILIIFLSIEELRRNFLKISYWLIFLVSLGIVAKMRLVIAILLAASACFSLFFSSGKKRILIGLLGIFIAYLCFMGDMFHIRQIASKRFAVDFISILNTLHHHHQARTFSAESAFLTNADISKPLNFLVYMPLFLLYIFFSPFPWAIFKINQIFAGIEMLLWYSLVIFAIRGLCVTSCRKMKETSAIFIFSLVIVIVSFGEGNVGTIFRHRALIWPYLFMLTSAGLFFSDLLQKGHGRATKYE